MSVSGAPDGATIFERPKSDAHNGQNRGGKHKSSRRVGSAWHAQSPTVVHNCGLQTHPKQQDQSVVVEQFSGSPAAHYHMSNTLAANKRSSVVCCCSTNQSPLDKVFHWSHNSPTTNKVVAPAATDHAQLTQQTRNISDQPRSAPAPKRPHFPPAPPHPRPKFSIPLCGRRPLPLSTLQIRGVSVRRWTHP